MTLTGANLINGKCMLPMELKARAEEFMRAHGEGVIISTVGVEETQALLSYALGTNPTYDARGICPSDEVVGAKHGVLFIPREEDRK
tara:strand:+ start:346 stop:606 length:261 start_codon:yes stop_codon:yes gene_type:complete